MGKWSVVFRSATATEGWKEILTPRGIKNGTLHTKRKACTSIAT